MANSLDNQQNLKNIQVCTCCSVSVELYEAFLRQRLHISSVISGNLPPCLYEYIHDDRDIPFTTLTQQLNFCDIDLSFISSWFKYFLLSAKRESIYIGKSDNSLFEYYQDLVFRIICLLKQRNIELLLFGSIPHRVISIAAFVAAKSVNIKTIFNYHNALIEESNPLKSIYAGSYSCQDLADIANIPLQFFAPSNKTLNHDQLFSLRNKSKFFNRGLHNNRFLNQKLLLSFLLQLFSRRNLTYGYFNPISRFRAVGFLLLEYLSYCNGRKFYLNNSIVNIPIEPYIILTLNRRPEANHSPHADAYIDDFRILQVLLAATKEIGCSIILKEHPNTFRLGFRPGTLVSAQRYSHMLNFSSRVLFFHPSAVDPHLAPNCIAVACSSQSAGLEACLANKKTIVFGHVWWSKVARAHIYSSVDSLSRYINSSNASDLPNIPIGSFPLKDFRSLSNRDYSTLMAKNCADCFPSQS